MVRKLPMKERFPLRLRLLLLRLRLLLLRLKLLLLRLKLLRFLRLRRLLLLRLRLLLLRLKLLLLRLKLLLLLRLRRLPVTSKSTSPSRTGIGPTAASVLMNGFWGPEPIYQQCKDSTRPSLTEGASCRLTAWLRNPLFPGG